MSNLEVIQKKYQALYPFLNERQRRLWAATEAQAVGHGGVTLVSQATGLGRKAIHRGLRELETISTETPEPLPAEAATDEEEDPPSEGSSEGIAVLLPGRLRLPGGGRKRLTVKDPTILEDLETLVDPVTRGDPISPLRWTCKSLEKLAEALRDQGHRVSPRKVADLLRELGYSLQGNRKSREEASHPDRNAQFERINADTQAFQERGQPVISVDTKKKELVGAFHQGGREWQPKGTPQEVAVHDFPDKELGKAIPYGVYDLARNEGWVSVGCDHDTAAFAVRTIRTWWERMGQPTYPEGTELLIIADGGGSNGSRSRLWKRELQRWADETGLTVTVRHFPPGTSKWNKIEHRMFCHLTENWRGRPLVSHEVIVDLIGSTTTRNGLRIQAELDRGSYPTGRAVSNDEFAQIRLEPDAVHGEWNYTIHPTSLSNESFISS
jgi:hypothetical protein